MFLLGAHVDTVFPDLTGIALIVTPGAPGPTGRCAHEIEVTWTVNNADGADTARVSRSVNSGPWFVRATVPLDDLTYTDLYEQLNPTATEQLRYRVEALNEGTTVTDTMDSGAEGLSCPI